MRPLLSRTFLSGILIFASAASFATELKVPIMERASDGLDTCALGEVTDLKTGGDGFLAVRSGPGTEYEKIDEIFNGDRVWMFEQKGHWIGVAYGSDAITCSPISIDHPLDKPGKKGWVHENWIKIIAG
ncbi:SH3 domain-containing protein [Roseibium sp.]|nr:SH3 domain-containing protein [Roseibium sp.]